MTFVPIVERELRIAARRKSTFRIRFWTAILAILVSFISLLFLWATRGRGSLGHPLFANLTGYAFGLCLLAGVFLTADCLSEEKREGTLGLLFLTDLHGYDVVFGKFAATLISALYGLLTLLPITALPLILGGVTAGEYWRTALALVNALFVSLTAGIWISSLVREPQKAMSRTFALILILVAGLPAAGASVSLIDRIHNFSFLAWVSPYYPFSFANAASYFGHPGRFWGTLVASQALGWLFLALASYTLPLRWQEGTVQRERAAWMARLLRRDRGGTARREKLRRDLLPRNPILWLVASEQGFGRAAWGIVIVWAGLVLFVTINMPVEFSTFVLGWYGARPFGFILKLLFTAQVCRFFVEARRNGTIEMLLCTPLTNREIIRGQSLAIQRNFLWPVVVFVSMLFVPVIVTVISGLSSNSFQQVITGGAGFAMSGITAVRAVADFFALFWFGLWLALNMKKPNFAPALTMLAVVILPAVLCWLDVFADLFFILFGVTRLQQDLRWTLAHQFQSTFPTKLQPTLAAVPPVITLSGNPSPRSE